MTDQPQEVVVLQNDQLATIATEDIITMAEHRVAQMQRLKDVALKATNAKDWVNQGGEPYMCAPGAEKVGRLFGVKVTGVTHQKIDTKDEKGPFYFYQYKGLFSLPGDVDSIEVVGTCSSKDQFFAKRGGELLPLSEIDETNIMKAAYTNMFQNGVTRLLGLRNVTWEQLEAAGIKKSEAANVEYKSGKDKQAAAAGTISEAQRKRLYAIACGREKDIGITAGDLCKQAMTDVCGEKAPEKTDGILKSDYDAIVSKVQGYSVEDFGGGEPSA